MLLILLQVFLSLILVNSCAANTEIIHFEVSSVNDVTLDSDSWVLLNPGTKERSIEATPAPLKTSPRALCSLPEDLLSTSPSCPHEVWFKLALDDEGWRHFSRFAFRVSWPASYPVDFSISILEPEALAAHFPSISSHKEPPSTSRVKYACVRVVDTGVPVPSKTRAATQVPFIVTVEPLRLGLVPDSIIPLLILIAPLLLSFLWVVPSVIQYVERVAEEARKEIYTTKQTKQE